MTDSVLVDPFTEADATSAAVAAAGHFDTIRQRILDNTDLCVDETTNEATADSCVWVVTDLAAAALAVYHGADATDYDPYDDPEGWASAAASVVTTLADAGWLVLPADLKQKIEADRAAFLAELDARGATTAE